MHHNASLAGREKVWKKDCQLRLHEAVVGALACHIFFAWTNRWLVARYLPIRRECSVSVRYPVVSCGVGDDSGESARHHYSEESSGCEGSRGLR